jgi:TRAP-type C4-dicarboxylate transport system permease small subunit
MSEVTALQQLDDDERKLLIDVKRDAARSFDQTMITLSGGALALSLTFVQQLAEKPAQWRAVLIAAWLAFGTALVLILFSFLLFQYAIDARIDGKDQPASVWDRWTRRANWTSLVSFGSGVVTLLIFCLKNFLR